MAIIYLVEQNTILRKTGDRLILCKRPPVNRYSAGVRESDILCDWPCADVDHVMVFGNIQITTQAMRQLLDRGIETAILTKNGELVGQLTPPCGKNVFLRIKQYESYANKKLCAKFAHEIVKAKVENALHFLREHRKNHPECFDRNDLDTLESTVGRVGTLHSIDSLLGYEGSASAVYFRILSSLLPEGWRFPKRSRRPPGDAANAVLSFGYTVLMSEICSLIDGAGLDPALGFYHAPDYGRPSLALDLLEIFRHGVIDRLAVSLFNLKVFANEDFTEPLPNGGVYMNESGKKKFLRQYERMMAGKDSGNEDSQEQAGYRKIVQDQVNRLVRFVKGEELFEPYCLRKA